MNESDVREEFIAPLLRRLGYQSGTDNNVIRELPLRYEKQQLGRKKPTDPELRGKADYVCEAAKRVRWVIEAKPPSAEITADDEEQSWSYASHPEVRAVLHCVTNGRELRVYRSNDGPMATPLYRATYNELAVSLEPLQGLLSPPALLAAFPEVEMPHIDGLGPGLGSVVRVASGSFSYDRISPRQYEAVISDLTFNIVDGCLDRNSNGQLSGYVLLGTPFRNVERFSTLHGLNRIDLTSDVRYLSTTVESPTVLRGSRQLVLPSLDTWPQIMGQHAARPPTGPITFTAHDEVNAVLDGRVLRGRFKSQTCYDKIAMSITGAGPFAISLA